MKKETIIITIAIVLVVAILIFFILGFLRKGPNQGNGNPGQPNNAPTTTQNQQR